MLTSNHQSLCRLLVSNMAWSPDAGPELHEKSQVRKLSGFPDFRTFSQTAQRSLQAKLPFATACKGNGVIWFVLNGGTGSYRIVKPLPNTDTRSQLKHKISPSLSLSLPPSAMGLLFVPCLNMLSGSTWFNKQSIPREVFQGKDAIVRPYSWGKYDNSSKIIYAMFTTARICTNIF